MPRPIVTLLTDFGMCDHYVGVMKAILLSQVPEVQLVDITHEIAQGDILAGSFNLERALAIFPARTVHLAVVDPGVGTSRRLLTAFMNGQFIVCPDNGLLTWPIRRLGPYHARQIQYDAGKVSHTFHGRDVMAPVAAGLAAGADWHSIGPLVLDPLQLLDVDLSSGPKGQIIYIDHFGNATTNLPGDVVRGKEFHVYVGGRDIGPVRQTYSDVAKGELLALLGSSELLEIAVHGGSATEPGVRVGDPIELVQ